MCQICCFEKNLFEKKIEFFLFKKNFKLKKCFFKKKFCFEIFFVVDDVIVVDVIIVVIIVVIVIIIVITMQNLKTIAQKMAELWQLVSKRTLLYLSVCLSYLSIYLIREAFNKKRSKLGSGPNRGGHRSKPLNRF